MVRGAMTMTQADIYYDLYDRDIYASAGPVHLRGRADAHNAPSHRVAAVHIAGDKFERVAVLELSAPIRLCGLRSGANRHAAWRTIDE
jgi:hypothetical protein